MIDCQIRHVGPNHVLLIELSGQLDSIGCDDLNELVERSISDDVKHLIIDCQGLSYISSNGLGMLVQLHTTMKKRGGEARIAGVQGMIAEVIQMVMLDKVLHLYPSAEEAIRSETE